LEGCLILLHELGVRGTPYNEAKAMVMEKMHQKRKLLTLKECIQEADKNCIEIEKVFN